MSGGEDSSCHVERVASAIVTVELSQVRTRDGRTLVVERRLVDSVDRRGSGDSVSGRVGPKVVFEAGMGASRHTWGAVAPIVAREAETVTYDRSGLGDSPVDDHPRNLARLASDLVDVVDSLGDGPLALVGHSWGGPVIRRAAEQRPNRIVGLVLVDVTEETCDLFFGKGAERQTKFAMALTPAIGRLGLLRLASRRFARSLPEPSASGMRSVDGTAAAARTQQAELRDHIVDLQGLLDRPPVLPEVPVTYISGGHTTWVERSRRPELIAAHRRAAEASALGRHVIAPASSHYVPLTDAALVAAEIERIVSAS